MATFLDIGILSHVRIVFVFIFVMAIIYAVLQKTKVLGDSKAIHSWIAISVALIFSLVSSTIDMLDIIMPSFTMLILFGFILSVVYIFLGGKASDIPSLFGEVSGDTKTMGTWILIITILIFLAGIGKIFFDPTSQNVIVNTNSSSSETIVASSDGTNIENVGEAAFWDTIFHPKVLGFILIMIIAVFTIQYMTKLS